MVKNEAINSSELLKVRGVTKYFGGLAAVYDMSFEIQTGEIVGLIGANGAGKTTLISLLAGFLKADKGQIFFKEVDITGEDSFDICKAGLVRTYQICRPFPNLSVFENVLIGALNRYKNLAQAQEVANRVVSFCELSEWAGVSAGNVSTVIRKRIELAKSLATQPDLILLDEVLAGLNPTEVEHSLELISKIHDDGTTILISEHNMSAIMKLSERIIVMNMAKKIAEGSPSEITSDERVVEAYLGKQ